MTFYNADVLQLSATQDQMGWGTKVFRHLANSDIFIRSAAFPSQLISLVATKPLVFSAPYPVDPWRKLPGCLQEDMCTQELPLLRIHGLDAYHVQRLVNLRRRVVSTLNSTIS